jgi:molecular chaperone GrpE
MSTKDATGKKNPSNSNNCANLKKQIIQLTDKLEKTNNQLLRTIADFQNYQKRMEKELKIKENETKQKYLTELIDLNELLKKAYEDKSPKDGLKLIIENIENFFEKEQIKYIECVGKQFDHNIHNAISTLEKENCEDNTIVEEIKKGYFLDDKLFRPSHVIVVKKKEKQNEVNLNE